MLDINQEHNTGIKQEVIVKVELVDPELPVPCPAYPGDVAVDLRSRIDVVLQPNEIKGIPTGIKIELPPLHEAQVRPRSGLALKHGITILNTPGTIDSEYRGEVVAIMVNHSTREFKINKGDRICQLAVRPVPKVEFRAVNKVSDTIRGEKGFGSSGV